MISFDGVTLRRGTRELLRDTNFKLHPGWHVGVVGRNGTGKSSLFAAILGTLSADHGHISIAGNPRIATVAQETPAVAQPAIEFVLDGDSELRELQRHIDAADAAQDAEALARLHEEYRVMDGYTARARAARLLDGLGFAEAVQGQAVAEFSGGWRMRLNLARALIARAPILLLDEPTNHLDLDAVIWLQEWIVSYPGTLLMVSHDRDFLDATTQYTLHLEDALATLYTGSYSQFELVRAERMALQAAAFAKQQQRIAHLEDFVRRFRAKATKAAQAQSRIKTLERMVRVAAIYADPEQSFSFPTPDRLPAPLLRVDDAEVGYANHMILRALRLSLNPGDRIGLLGRNGAGKSTLMRLLAGELRHHAGTLHRDPYLRIGYYTQETTAALDLAASPLLHLRRLDGGASEQSLRTFLGSFDFSGERALQAVSHFSGGEKARLALALLVYQKPNLLLLDEPTNHLDLDMRGALEMALADFPGAVVLVSHDRHLLTATSNEFWLVADGLCKEFSGDLQAYVEWLRKSRAPVGRSTAAERPTPRNERQAAADQRQRLRPLRESIRRLDVEMEQLRVQLADIDRQLADGSLYRDGQGDAVSVLIQQQGQLRKQLSIKEDEWLHANETLEAFRA